MPSTILIVEDTDYVADVLEFALFDVPGCCTQTVVTAQAAWNAVNDPSKGVCAVVTDVGLPDFDGWELVRRLRTQPDTRALPVLVVSGQSEFEGADRASTLGPTRYFSKPYSPAQVRQTLEQMLHAR